MFSNFYWLNLHNNTHVALNRIENQHIYNKTYAHKKKLNWKLDLACFSYSYQNCMFVDYLTRYIGPPYRVHYWE